MNPLNIFLWMAFTLALFGVGFVIWSHTFGIPCWAFDGGVINDTITREAIERCGR